jgi:Collagen triple helix repeat (20 copies)
MRNRILDWCALGLLLPVLPACGGDTGATGAAGPAALLSVSAEAAGDNCEFAGKRVEYGTDEDSDGTLDAREVEDAVYICDGMPGADGEPGTPAPTGPAGADGTDGANGTNGEDGADGADGTNGSDGADGTNGSDGADGTNGSDGADGTNGSDGAPGNTYATLLAIETEPLGAHCIAGGSKFLVGIDNGDGESIASDNVLQAGEVDQTSYVCNPPFKRVFVSSTLTQGAFGGLAGGDAICQAAADAASLGGTYLAWLSSSTGSPSTRFTRSDSPYSLVNGRRIAANWSALVSHELDIENNVALTEQNVAYEGMVYTATYRGGYFFGERDCDGWTSVDPAQLGTVNVNTSNGGMEVNDFVACDVFLPLYCFEQ